MNKIASKLFTIIVLNIIIIFMISWVFQVSFLKKYYISQQTRIMEKEINNIIFMIENKISLSDVLDEITNFSSAYGCLVIFTDENFNMNYISSSQIQNSEKIIYQDIEYIKTRIQSQTQEKINSFITEGRRFNSILSCTSINGTKKGYIIIQSFIEPINTTIVILKRQLLVVCLISLFVGSVIAFAFSRKFSKPILEINDFSKKIAEGDFDATVSIKSKDEVGILAHSINNMAYQLKKKDDIKNKFIANMSHELKTPISSIRAYAELLLDYDMIEKKEGEKYAEIIVMNSKRLTLMVEDILELSKIQSGKYVLKLSSFCVIDLIKRVINEMKVIASHKNLNIILNTFNDEIFINADIDKMYSVFCNILQNSIRYCHSNGIVKIEVISKSSDITISITDNGGGIPKENLPYVWERFYKCDKSKNSEKSGTGLGMAIVKEILKLHNYTYGIESEIDVGTQVWFNIPQKTDRIKI